MQKNPFDISFGKKPNEMISTFFQTREVTETFDNDPITQQIFMIVGVRGSGKTVFMNTIANQLEQEADWIVIRLNPDRDLLQAMASKMYSIPECVDIFRKAKLNLSILGLGVEISGVPPITDMESAIEQMLKHLKQSGKRVLVTVDEVTGNPYIKAFCSSFQIMIGRELPLFLLMTGLYENIEELQNEKNLTFLFRAPKIRMAPLNTGRIADRYEKIFTLPHEKALEMAEMTKGYPFAFQALGYCMWNHQGDLKGAEADYRQLLEEFVYEKIWSELSAKDKQIVTGIARFPGGRVRDISSFLGLKTDEINQYRKRLIRKGIVSGAEYGHLSFTLPLFERFVEDQRTLI